MVDKTMQAIALLRKQVEDGVVDLPRELLRAAAERLMNAEADALCGAGYGERSDERVNQRNGYRKRDWDTRVGTVSLAIPKLRTGSYFPEWLLEPRRRAEKALAQVIAEAYVRGISTRRVEGLVQTMGIEGMSKSQVSQLAAELDELVESFRNRPLDSGPYTYLWLDAVVVKSREGGRIVNVALVVATGVNVEGYREILGVDLVTTEDGASWTAFLRSLVARGLNGVQLVISDAHGGLKDAVGAVLQGAAWQRCRTHFMRNLLTRVPKSAQDAVATLVRTVFSQASRQQVEKQYREVVERLRDGGFAEAADMLVEAEPDLTAFKGFPKEHWKQIWSNNPQERLNKEIKRRTNVVGIFPNRAAVVRLVGAVLAEQHDEWAVCRRYMNPNTLAKARMNVIEGALDDKTEELNRIAAG